MRNILIICLVLAGCHSKHDSKIHIVNNSNSVFDSAIVFINDYKLKTTEITRKGKLEIVIPVDSVTTNSHDVMMPVNLYYNNGTDTLRGMFYTDLGGSLSRKYEILVTEQGKLRISPVGY